MTGFFHAVKQVFEGTRAMDETKKYQAIELMIGIVHLIFMLIFCTLHIWVMFVYNVFAVIYYLTMVFLTGKTERYTFVFVSMFVEILFHSVFASILLGWDWGFMIYTVALVPTAFYICFTITFLKRSVLIPAAAAMIVSVVYFIMRAVMGSIEPVLDGGYPVKAVHMMYYFNTILAFAYLWTVSVLFSIEIRFMEKSLESENRSLEYLAKYDPLTHLLNRRSMNTFLHKAHDEAVELKEPFCLIMADIDDFKQVNDNYGHNAGDEVLINVAEVISNNVREDDYVCRWGGEEVLVLIKADRDVAVRVAERICEDVRNTVVDADGVRISVTLTMGVVKYQTGDNIRTMVEKADKRLYYGKSHGKNQVVAK